MGLAATAPARLDVTLLPSFDVAALGAACAPGGSLAFSNATCVYVNRAPTWPSGVASSPSAVTLPTLLLPRSAAVGAALQGAICIDPDAAILAIGTPGGPTATAARTLTLAVIAGAGSSAAP
jgi:hypothetical protein